MSLFNPIPDATTPGRPCAPGRAHAAALPRRVRRPGASARPGQAPPRRNRARRSRLDDLLGPSRHRQNHPRQDHRRDHPGHLHRVLRRHVRHQGDQAGHGRRGESRRLRSRTILFIDEIHRFNKAQQDAFLPYVERGAIRLIGATTENPSFELIAALLSRCRVYTLSRSPRRRSSPCSTARWR